MKELNEKIDRLFKENNNKDFHHIAFVVPHHFHLKKMNEMCKKVIEFKKQKLFMGFFYHNKLCVELLKPSDVNGPISKYLNSDSFIFDHYCFYKHQSKKYYPVTEIFYSDLWNKNCQFFLDINYKKYELIYEN